MQEHVQMMTLGTVATYINGRAFKPAEWETSGLPIIRIQNLTSSTSQVNYTTQRFEDKYLVHNSDLLFAWSASLGAHMWNGGDAWLNQHIFRVVPNEGIDKKYLYYYLCKIVQELYSKTHGSGMVHITKEPFMNTAIPVYPLEKQQRIVAHIEELFSQLDDAEATLQKTKAQLALYRQAVYSSAYKGMEANHSINEFFDITGGITKNSKRGSMQNKRPYLRVANVYYNRLDLSEIKEIGVTDAEIEKCTLLKNDLLFVEGNGSKSQIGRVAIWDGSIPSIVHQNHIIKGRPNGKMLPAFALFYLMSPEGRKQITDVAKSTSGLYTLTTDKVRKLKVPFCQIPEQNEIISEINSRLSICDNIEQTVDKALQQNNALRMSILKQSFEGGY